MPKRHKITKDPRTGELYVRIMRNGVSKRFKLGKNMRKAESKLLQIERDVESGRITFDKFSLAVDESYAKPGAPDTGDPNRPDLHIKQLAEIYLNWVETNRAPATLATKKYLLTPFVRRYGNHRVSEITQLLLADYYAWARKQRGKSENGGNHHMREVKTMLLWGVDMNLCEMPIRKFPMVRNAPPPTKRFTDEELVAVFKVMDEDFKDMLLFGILTGLRPQELRQLSRHHVIEQDDTAYIALERHKTYMSAREYKPRCVPLSGPAIDILKRQCAKHQQDDLVFLNAHGEPYTAGWFRQRLERACDRAEIPRRTPYALRHLFGTKQAGGGLNQTILAQVMGHATIRTTSRYVDPVQEYHQKAMDAMAKDMAFLLDKNPIDSPAVPSKPPLRIADASSEDGEQVMQKGA